MIYPQIVAEIVQTAWRFHYARPLTTDELDGLVRKAIEYCVEQQRPWHERVRQRRLAA